MRSDKPQVGAKFRKKGGTHFVVWAPNAKRVDLHLLKPKKAKIGMLPFGRGYFEVTVENIKPDARYMFALDNNKPLPDPASRFQPEGVHGPSAVVGSSFKWADDKWSGISFRDLVIYELHIGTFTSLGTLQSAAQQLTHLKKLGVTAVELMPVAQFPGQRNWGYDGVYPFAVQNSYGGPAALKAFVQQCHQQKIAVILDVVYNHLGPEGNYLGHYGPYFQNRYTTPWGPAINFDGPRSDEVRHYFLQNAAYWLDEFHIDGLRLDAVHAICDLSARPFLQELACLKLELEQKTNRSLLLIGESDANDSCLIRPLNENHIGLDGQWSDDFHHAVHAVLTGERQGYYKDFGELAQVIKTFRNGVVYDGQFSIFRQASHGRDYSDIDYKKLIVCSQNHDQIGNRMQGERLSVLVDDIKLKLAASLVFLSPFTPLLFMGEEYGERAPFLYFADHSDATLIRATREGRAKEFQSFDKELQPVDPFDINTFRQSCIDLSQLETNETAKGMLAYYQKLIRLSKSLKRQGFFSQGAYATVHHEKQRVIALYSKNKKSEIHCLFSFSDRKETVKTEGVKKKLRLLLSSLHETPNELSAMKIELLPFSVVVLKG